jgi:RNA polymerase primary sigma factor
MKRSKKTKIATVGGRTAAKAADKKPVRARKNQRALTLKIQVEMSDTNFTPAIARREADRSLDTEARATERLDSGSYSSLHLYLREVGQVALVTPQEEWDLAERIRGGDEEARQQLIKANLRLVVKIARDYEGLGLPLLDLINEGNIGLMKAVNKFDPRKGAKFSTYSSWWIKQSMRRAVASQGKTIRLPSHVIEKLCRIRQAATKLHELLGREPSNEEIAVQIKMKPAKVAALRRAAIPTASLEMTLGEDDKNRLYDLVPDERAEEPGREMDDGMMTGMLREFIGQLSAREAGILRFRFGLDGGSEKTLEEVGRRFGVTRERSRQLQTQALLKLRQMLEAREARSFAA